MPVTGNLDQENPAQDEAEAQQGLVSTDQEMATEPGQTQSVGGSPGPEVSSTTTDPDPATQVRQESGPETMCEPVQSTSSVDISPDSLDGFTHVTPSEQTSKTTTTVPTSTAQISKGFQDAFAAFASASLRQPEEDNAMDVSGEAAESSAEPQESAESTADATCSAAEPIVSSAIDSALVTTTGDTVTTNGHDMESVQAVTADISEEQQQQEQMEEVDQASASDPQPAQGMAEDQVAETEATAQPQDSELQEEAAPASDSVYFIQTTDASGQVVTSIIDPADIHAYADSVVYKQCMKPNGEIETTIVHSGGVTQEEEQAQEPQAAETQQQIIYAHDINGQLTPIDSAQSANDVAPPGKQFVYMQDSTGRIIRTIMDANQTMVPGQQVYYTQSEDGRIITSVMDPATAGEDQTQQQPDVYQQQQQQVVDEAGQLQQQQMTSSSVMGGTSSFNIDNGMSGLSMLAELSHLTAGQATPASSLAAEHRGTSSTDSNSVDMDEFRPVAMVTRRITSEEGLDSVNSDIASLSVGETDSGSSNQGDTVLAGPQDSLVSKIVAEMKADQSQAPFVSRDNLFVQWQNLDAMCWMDVVLVMLVYSPTLRPLVNLEPTHELASTLLITLLKANRQAQVLLQNLLKKSNGAEVSSLQTGAGNSATIQDPKTSKLVCKENMDEIGKAINILYAMREKIWQAFQPRLRCERGKHNSPVLVLPLLVREKPAIKEMFTMKYRYVFKCEKCGYSQDDSHTKILPSIPAVPVDFNMKCPSFVRNCFECQAPDQRMLMKFEGLNDFVQMHFVKGLPHNRFEELSFDFSGDHYEVTAVVHYKNNPDHFIAWVRNAPGPAWMECDDLKSVITRYQNVKPNIPPGQVHMVMWERRLTPQHTLVMRDTEDTKLLASLVLTVQQPNTHQTTDPAARPTGVPSAPALPASSVPNTQPSSMALLSGLMNQSQNFSPYTPRGRGRGRGSRGGYGTRGRGMATTTLGTPIIRRATPTTVAQVSSPVGTLSPRPRTTTQIVRLPLSALASAGLNLGGTSTGPRYIFVGSGGQTGSTTTTTSSGGPSKVVVVRSQGAGGSMTASQLLQLLQRSGAISQGGARITTTVSTASAGASATPASGPTTSYIIQPDGTVTTTTSTAGQDSGDQVVATDQTQTQSYTAVTAAPADVAGDQSAETLMETEALQQVAAEASQAAAVDSHQQQISTLAFTGSPTNAAGTGQASSDADMVSPAAAAGQSVGAVGSPSSDAEVKGEQPSSTVRTLSFPLGQQTNPRYISIPNPAGGGNILTQLVNRGGKMVLVPVDKNTQLQATSAPSEGQAGSPKVTIRAGRPAQQIVSGATAGAILSQLQQQQQQDQVSSTSAVSFITTTTTTTTTASPRFITLPGTSGGKRTIQLITVPKGASSGQGGQKTVIMAAPSSLQTSIPSSISTLATQGDTVNSEGRILSQSGNIVIRELKRPEGEGSSTLITSLGTDSVTSGQQLMSTPAVSLLRDVSARSTAASSAGVSLLASPPHGQQKSQESFRYILPGSNTTHILHTGTTSSQGLGKAFTALSSSGTIIGGQLTPSPVSSAVGTSPMDQDLTLGDSDDSSHSTTTLVTRGRGRARGRGQRGGRGRGGRTPRGRGRAQSWTTDLGYTATPQVPGRKISTLSDLRQIGAHIIKSDSEAVDGVPVVSIPDFSPEVVQSEASSAADAIVSDGALSTTAQTVANVVEALPAPQSESTSSQPEIMSVTDAAQTHQGPRVITQPIPSIKANHGFDILTQGIMGLGGTARPQLPLPKQGRSLLTGAPATIHPPTSLLSPPNSTVTQPAGEDTSPSPLSPSASRAQQNSSMGQSEIDTLIQAAEAAAKPARPGAKLTTLASIPSETPDTESEQVADKTDTLTDKELSQTEQKKPQLKEDKKEERVMTVDESQVSTAERYRMPMELFQPDDEVPEKPVRMEEGADKGGVELPSRLFQDTEMSSQDDILSFHGTEIPKKRGSLLATKSPVTDRADHGRASAPISSPPPPAAHTEDSVGGDVDIETAEDSTSSYLPKATEPTTPSSKSHLKRRGKRKGSSGRKGGRRKSNSVSASEPMETDAIPVSPTEQLTNTVPPKISVNEKVTFPISSPRTEREAGETSPVRKVKTSIGGFATDLLQESYKEEYGEQLQQPEPEQKPVKHAVEKVKKDTKPSHALSSDSSRTAGKLKDYVKRKLIRYLPAVVPRRKHKVNWQVDGEAEESDTPPAAAPFSFKVLSNSKRKPHPRHPSLGPAQLFYVSPPSPLPLLESKVDTLPSHTQSSPAIVKRRDPKPLQRPKVDPSKEPMVIPLVAEDESDPACTGGSVVTSPVDGEIFTGVILKYRRETADWSSALEEEEEEEEVDVIEDLSGEDLKAAQREYCKQLLTVFYMEAGDFIYCGGQHSEDEAEEEEEEESVEIDDEGQMKDDSIDEEKIYSHGGSNKLNSSSSQEGESCDGGRFTKAECGGMDDNTFPHTKQKRMMESIDSPTTAPPTKRFRLSQDDDVEIGQEGRLSMGELTTSPPSRVNGIDNVSTPAHSSQQSPDLQASQKDTSSSAPTSFPSPSRRSGRTPIPSKRVLDAWEDAPVRSSPKDRRASLVSSDEEHSGYGSGDMPVKKHKNKQTPAPL